VPLWSTCGWSIRSTWFLEHDDALDFVRDTGKLADGSEEVAVNQ
jgi:hypothetical protein